NAVGALLQHVCINFCGFDIIVAKLLLHCANRYCQPNDFDAEGYFRVMASGIHTPAYSFPLRSCSSKSLTFSIWLSNAGTSSEANVTIRCLAPLPFQIR